MNYYRGGYNIIISPDQHKKICTDYHHTLDFLEPDIRVKLSPEYLPINNEKKEFLMYISKYIDIDRITYHYNKYISRGTYGVVISYKSNDNVYIAVKYGKDCSRGLIDDIKIYNILQSSNICRGSYVNSYIYSPHIVIMKYMNGTLDQLSKNIIDHMTILRIMHQLIEAVHCLCQNNLIYLDIKSENVLYRCEPKNNIDIVLGDIGGIVERNEGGVATLPSPDKTITEQYKGHIKNAENSDVIWSLGILFLSLIKGISVKKYHFDSKFLDLSKQSQDNIKKDLLGAEYILDSNISTSMLRYFHSQYILQSSINDTIDVWILYFSSYGPDGPDSFDEIRDLLRGMLQVYTDERLDINQIKSKINSIMSKYAYDFV